MLDNVSFCLFVRDLKVPYSLIGIERCDSGIKFVAEIARVNNFVSDINRLWYIMLQSISLCNASHMILVDFKHTHRAQKDEAN